MSVRPVGRVSGAASRAPRPERVWLGIGVGAGTVAGLTLLKLAVETTVGHPTAFLLYFTAALSAAWLGGYAAGVVTTVLAAVAGNLAFLGAAPGFSTSVEALTTTLVFALEGVALTVVTARLQTERRRSANAVIEVSTALDRQTAVFASVGAGITVQDPEGRFTYANEVAARMCGFASADEMLRSPPMQIVERFELLHANGAPLANADLPSQILLRGGEPSELLVKFRVRATDETRWSIVRSNPVRDDQGVLRFVVNAFTDVTEKRAQDEALRISQEWFATALRSIGDAVITTDRDGNVTFLNPVAETLTGWTTALASGAPLAQVFDIFDETTLAPIESPAARVVRDGVAVGLSNHAILRRRDRHERAIDHSAAPIQADGGEIVGVVLVFRDVSVARRTDARKAFLMRATAELNSSLDYEKTLAMVARLAVPMIADWCAVDMRDGDEIKRLAVAHVDPEKIRLVEDIERRYPPDPNAATGVPHVLRSGAPELIEQLPAAMLDAAALDDAHLALIRQLGLHSYIAVPIKHGDRTSGVITLVMAESKRTYDQDDLAFSVSLGQRAAIAIENASLYREADRLRAEASAQRDRLYAMIMASPTAICVLRRDPELRFEMMNAPYRARFGADVREGAPVSTVEPEATNLAMLERVFDTGEPAFGTEIPIRARFADGASAHYVSFSIQPLRDLTGVVDRIVLFADDVTDQVLARNRVEAARNEAELANRSKDEFLAILGHELRNPLAPILSALDLIAMGARHDLDRSHAIIARQVKHMVRLVDDLLDVSRITRGKVELAREVVDLADIVVKALELSLPLLVERGQEVTTHVEPGLRVDGDPTRLSQVVANIVQNAAKYTDKGGRIDIRGTREAGDVVLRVRDNGMGMAPDILPRVFDLFAQEAQALDRARGGLGIGLAIVKSLVTQHGGTVEAHSAGPGTGSELVVRLPAAGDAAVLSSADPERPAPDAAGVRVLIVDDNVDALELLGMALELLGYHLLRAHDGASALELAARERPQVALLDIGLPVMDGFELARRLRQTPGLASLRLIAITGYGQASDRERSAAAGFDVHLVKPVTVEAVRHAIELVAPR